MSALVFDKKTIHLFVSCLGPRPKSVSCIQAARDFIGQGLRPGRRSMGPKASLQVPPQGLFTHGCQALGGAIPYRKENTTERR